MKMKYFLGSLMSFMISISAFAQTNPGVDFFSLGEMKLAKEHFTKSIGQTPDESYYYLGEIAFAEGNLAEAKSNFEKGLASNPESALNAVGLAKLDLKSNQKEAESQLSAVLKKNKKDVIVILAIAKAYLDNGMKDKALEKLQDARKADKKSPWIYIFEGDMLAKEGKPGDAAMQYDQAINFDANFAIAYIKGAQVYQSINSKTAIGMLQKAIEIRPEYSIAHKYLAKLYYKEGFYPEAIAEYKIYFASKGYTAEDIKDYASAEYFTQGYDAAVKLLQAGLAVEPDNFVLNRLLMYSKNELKDFQGGLAAGEKFFSIQRTDKDTVKYIVQDFMAYGNILSETGNKVKAIEQYRKAIELDPSKVELNKEIAVICANEDMYPEAISFLKKYIELGGEKVEASDYFQLGRYYYSLANGIKATEAVQAAEYFKEADAIFATVIERIPESHLGYLWRARANSSLDPLSTEGLAKPFYEQTISVILAKEGSDNKRELIEAYTYLSYYYYLQFIEVTKSADAKAKMIESAQKLLELDPTNNTATELLNAVK